ncbi:MAG: PIN domain-containing protein [Verrucomicrobiota bacterium]
MDTNVLLRFLLNDHPEHGPAARELFRRAGAGEVCLEFPFGAIFETVFVLFRHYRQPRRAIADELLKLIEVNGIKLRAPAWITDALREFGDRGVSFGDACIAAEARVSGLKIASFDRDFDSFAGVTRCDPAAGQSGNV